MFHRIYIMAHLQHAIVNIHTASVPLQVSCLLLIMKYRIPLQQNSVRLFRYSDWLAMLRTTLHKSGEIYFKIPKFPNVVLFIDPFGV